MNKNELKKVLKPLIKECIKEAIFEEGVLSGIISEVAKGINSNVVVEAKKPKGPSKEEIRRREEQYEKERQEKIRRLNESMNVNGVNIFEGTKQVLDAPQNGNPMSGVRPDDAGVDLNSIIGSASKKWKHLI